ncbi:MAG: hypothetical protein IJE94_07670 [Oscillospiraceae bacterium]|nr:hypothetical protein [Oscillospiraceae bacterium]
MMEAKLKRAESLYAAKKYKEAVKICLELVNEKEQVKEAWLLAAKSLLFSMGSPLNEESNKALFTTVGKAYAAATTFAEVQEIEHEVTDALNEWEEEKRKKTLVKLESNPTLDQFNEYLFQDSGYARMRISFSLETIKAIRSVPDDGTDKQERGEEKGRSKSTAEEGDVENYKLLVYETALRVFEETKKILTEKSDIHADAASNFASIVLERLLTAEAMVRFSIPKKGISAKESGERLKTFAKIITYRLDALIYPNGKALSLYLGNREEDINEIKDTYSKIKKIDPTFVAPALPSVEPITPKNLNGGCYVATAVYGSYDCPQVWTLRRFRDYTLAKTWYGRALIRTYYAISPALVSWFGHTDWFKKLWRGKLDGMVAKLNATGVESTPYEDKKW